MLIDNFSKTKRRGYCLIQCLTLIAVAVLLAFFSPNTEETINSNVSYEAQQLNDSQVFYELSVSDINSLNRYMIIDIEATTNSVIGVEKEISVKGAIYGSYENKDTKEKSKEIQVIDKKLIINCPFPKNSVYLNYKKYFLSLTITENSAVEALQKINFQGDIKRGFLRFYLIKILFSVLFFAFLATEAIFGRLQSWGFTHNELFPWEKSNYPVVVISVSIQLIALFWFLYLFYQSRIECVPHPVLNLKWSFLSNSIITLFLIVIVAITFEKSLKLTNSSFLEISFLIVSNLWMIVFSIPFFPTQGTRKILNENTVTVDPLQLSDDSSGDRVSSQSDNEFELSENQYGEDLNSQESFKENSSEF
ncbi:transmembrane protein [Anaeramoeba flamelloides]|uniref:Transmembrane protein n=1 Tax=Anaeramoeba flamelloides TaxID=1746091 RepID=A0AAV7ZCY9_9EUKA|nr:transmembrane protein [Anaeramoeba flamelloides]